MLARLSFEKRVMAIGAAAVVGFLILSVAVLLEYRRAIYTEKHSAVRQVVESTASLVQSYVAAAVQGRMPVDEARKRALADVKALRYSGDEYFFVIDQQPRMVMHAVKPEMDGQDLSDYKDPNGKRLFVEMVDVVRRSRAGIVNYDWPKAGSPAPEPKVSYVVGIPEWGWIVGSGVYASDVERDVRSVALVMGGVALVVVLLCIVLVWYFMRTVVRPLTALAEQFAGGAKQVASASGQVASSSQSLSQGATEQAAALEETSASMEELASMTRKNAENSQEAASQVAESARLLETANAALEELVASMRSIRDSSTKVSQIIRTIDEIAFQTNILALNAAVEAARAGEAGAGFAVVADEVRTLAQRSAQAASDTSVLIEESTTNAAAGATRVDAVAAAMSAITENSARIRGLVTEVTTASAEQSRGIDQVTHAISQMEKVTQVTAATAEENAAASEELNAQAEDTARLVRELESVVHGTGGRAIAA